ncbi:Programmed cell death protein 2 [Taenia solium]|eukprot:TsM_000355500 transcript=TsM_000355500 gene=TsM_000355500
MSYRRTFVTSKTDQLMPSVTLGFIEPRASWHLVSHLFPDKVGGRPAWLALSHLPGDLECPHCHHRMVFLLQLYSPLDDREDCFHRMLFVFMCKNGTCFLPQNGVKTQPFRVFRSQLPKENPYYSSKPPSESEEITEESMVELFRSGKAPMVGLTVNLCPVCGCPGTKCCVNCNKAYYCSKEHQIIHWKQNHKIHCPDYDYLAEMFQSNSFLLPEFSLASETLDRDGEDTNEVYSSDDESNYEVVEDSEFSSADKEEFKALEEASCKETQEDQYFNRFKEILRKEPDQVVRFDRGGVPLWATPTPIIPPPCVRCGGKRIFEFQITPQLLSHLKLDKVGEASPDFATVYVFTCENSCSLAFSGGRDNTTTETYVEEFVTFDSVP